MAIENIFNYYDKEKQLLEESLKEIEELYNETKNHSDIIKQSRVKGSLTFLEKQTANLVSLKAAKLQIIKELINIKKLSSDYDLKTKTDDISVNGEILGQIFKKLNESDNTGIIEEDYKDLEEDNDIDSLLSKRATELSEKGEIKFSDNDLLQIKSSNKENNEEENGKLCIAKRKNSDKWNFIMMNEFNKIIKIATFPVKSKYQMRFITQDGSKYGVDQNDRMYKVFYLKG